MALPSSPACERNRDPILAVLREQFADRTQVLEIGSGTGQHAGYFAAALPHLRWQATERQEHLPNLVTGIAAAELRNTPEPVALDVNDAVWPAGRYDALFSANTLHIMSWPEVKRLFAKSGTVLAGDARIVIYGPFNYGGQFTSASNAAFDAWLKAQAPHRGIRDFEAVDALARGAGFFLEADIAMPANNRCLAWSRPGNGDL